MKSNFPFYLSLYLVSSSVALIIRSLFVCVFGFNFTPSFWLEFQSFVGFYFKIRVKEIDSFCTMTSINQRSIGRYGTFSTERPQTTSQIRTESFVDLRVQLFFVIGQHETFTNLCIVFLLYCRFTSCKKALFVR